MLVQRELVWYSENAQLFVQTRVIGEHVYRMSWWDKSNNVYWYNHGTDLVFDYEKPFWDLHGRYAYEHHQQISAKYMLIEHVNAGYWWFEDE